MTQSKNIGKLLMVISAFMVSLGQLMWKFSGVRLNALLISGFFFYGIGFVLMLISFKTDQLSKLYPFMSLSYVFAAIYSSFLLQDPISLKGFVGIILICSGVIFLGRDKS